MDAGSLPDVRENQSHKLTNKLSASTEAYFSKQKSCYEKNTCSKQESITKIQKLVKTMKSTSESLLHMTQDDLSKTSHNIDSCLSESSSQYILLTTLTDMITSCTHSMNVLQHYVKRYLPCSKKCSTNIFPREKAEIRNNYGVDDYGMIRVPVQDVVCALVEILPTFFTEDFQLEEELKDLARKVSLAENSCDICLCELKTVWIIIQKMFLFLSLGSKKPEVKYSIDELVSCLLSANFPCESESDAGHLSDGDYFLSKSISSIYLLPFVDGRCSFRSDISEAKSNEDLESSKSEFNSDESSSNLQRDYVNFHSEILKIAHIESPYTSDEIGNENKAFKTELNEKHVGENDSIPFDASTRGTGSALFSDSLNEVRKEKSVKQSLGKFWTSLDSFPRSKTSGVLPPEVENELSSNSSTKRVPASNEKLQRIQDALNKSANNFSPNCKSGVNGSNYYPNSRTTSSSFTNLSNFEHATDTSKKVRTDTVLVKMTNRGEGFGLILAVKGNSSRSSFVPVIHSIKPRSPAHRTGVLKVGDRIVAINSQNTLGITPNELRVLSKQSFSAKAIKLKVEFDVVEAEPKFGTFDVILDKTLKIGLLFEDMERGFPMLVSGIVKGSGAHRCGQLFSGDRIKFFRCMRNEEFDPVSCNYSKEESVLITVQRYTQAGLREKSVNASPPYFNPSFSREDPVPRRGRFSVVRNTTVHSVGGTLVQDQEVTLFRDPVFWDFGFLVGENPDTGRAYVTDVRPEGPASDSGALKKYDRIVQVNGVLVDRNVESSVLGLLSQANHKVDLLIRRLYREDSKTV